MVDPEVIIVPIVFFIPSAVIFARMWFKHKEKMAGLGATPATNPGLEARLARIEEAVDTIAVEMERMGEGQRFVTKLLAERASAEGGKDTTDGESGRLTTKR
jgi:hypothetical protein